MRHHSSTPTLEFSMRLHCIPSFDYSSSAILDTEVGAGLSQATLPGHFSQKLLFGTCSSTVNYATLHRKHSRFLYRTVAQCPPHVLSVEAGLRRRMAQVRIHASSLPQILCPDWELPNEHPCLISTDQGNLETANSKSQG